MSNILACQSAKVMERFGALMWPKHARRVQNGCVLLLAVFGVVCGFFCYRALLKQFLTMEVIPWQQLQQEYAVDMAAEPEVFADPKGKEDLQLRVVEHVSLFSSFFSPSFFCHFPLPRPPLLGLST